MKQRALIAALLISCVFGLAQAAEPPGFLNYQGVLRDADDVPLDGTYSMIFRFYDTEVGGQSILVDRHTAVTVTGGLFTVQIGTGNILDGDGPGTYTDLPKVFAQYQDLHLEIEIEGEVLEPRTAIAAAGYALNARYVNGVEVADDAPLDLYVDASSGNDDNDGMWAWSPKRTIQAAIDRIPTIIGGDVTVHIAPGTYAERVRLLDRNFRGDATITLIGEGRDVRITGDLTRDYALEISDVQSFVVENLELVDTTSYNLRLMDSTGTVRSCTLITTTAPFAGSGVLIARSFVTIEDSAISQHLIDGLVCTAASRCFLNDVDIIGNLRGMDVLKASQVRFMGPARIMGNTIGCRAFGHGEIDFRYEAGVNVTGNSSYDLFARFLGAIFAYTNSPVGACVAQDYSVCSPTY